MIEKFISSINMSPNTVKINHFNIRENFIESEDSWIIPDHVTQNWIFYDLDMREHKKLDGFANIQNPNAIFQSKFFLCQTGMKFRREVYNFWDVFGDLAGRYELIVSIFGISLYSVA